MHEWYGHLEIFSRPQVREISRQYLLLRTYISQKTVVGCPWEVQGLVIDPSQRFFELSARKKQGRKDGKGKHLSYRHDQQSCKCTFN